MRKAKRSSTYQAQDKGDRRTLTIIERDDAVSARKLAQLVTGVSRVSVEDRHEILDALCSFSNETEVNEAELLALIMEHPHTPNSIKGAIRYVMIAAFDKLGKSMREKSPDGQLVRDVFPHACFVHSGFYDAFQIVLKDLEQTSPRVINSIENHAARGQTPPRYPHPLTSLIPDCRVTLTGELKTKRKRGAR